MKHRCEGCESYEEGVYGPPIGPCATCSRFWTRDNYKSKYFLKTATQEEWEAEEHPDNDHH